MIPPLITLFIPYVSKKKWYNISRWVFKCKYYTVYQIKLTIGLQTCRVSHIKLLMIPQSQNFKNGTISIWSHPYFQLTWRNYEFQVSRKTIVAHDLKVEQTSWYADNFVAANSTNWYADAFTLICQPFVQTLNLLLSDDCTRHTNPDCASSSVMLTE